LNKEEGAELKPDKKDRVCPLLNKPCILGECSWYMTIQNPMLGAGRAIGTCALVASVIVSSYQKQLPTQKLELPGLRR